MKHRWAALVTVLALCAFMSGPASAQSGSGQTVGGRGPGALGPNVPNPFNPDTRIPFTVGMVGDPPVCAEGSRVYRVSLRIHNVLSQPVAVPVLQGGGEHGGRPIENLPLSCGEFQAWWDGKVRGTAREVASGVYYAILEVDGRRAHMIKMLVMK